MSEPLYDIDEPAQALDLFAGPGGWDVGVSELGINPLGVEWDAWQGTKSAQYLQVGNAVPPLMARRIVESLTGVVAEEVAA